MTSLAFMNVLGSSAAATAKFVNGPIPIKVMVSGGFSPRIRRISRGEWRFEGVNKFVGDAGLACAALTATEESSVAGGGGSKR